MSQVKLPQIKLIQYPTRANEEVQYNVNQPSSLVTYLGITANGATKNSNFSMREYNAVPIIAYYDIFKNYYANKQEENFYLMSYENQVSQVTAMTAPSGGTQIWKVTVPNRMDNSLPDERNNTILRDRKRLSVIMLTFELRKAFFISKKLCESLI